MRIFMIGLILAVMAGTSAQAQAPLFDLTGWWISTTGARIEVFDGRSYPGKNFVFVAHAANGARIRTRCVWRSSELFVYRTAAGEEIFGSASSDGKVYLSNSNASWQSVWTR